MVRKAWVSFVVVAALTIAVLSLAYPSVVVSNVSTQPIANLATYTSQYAVGHPEITASTFLAGYSSVTAWYPGNPICDPASNACTPYPTPTATLVYPQSTTYPYHVTLESQTSSTFSSEYTLFSTETSFQSVPPYAVAGLTEFQFGIAVMVIVVAVVLSLLFLTVRSGPRVVSEATGSNSDSSRTIRFCQGCGAQNARKDKFCGKCGTRLE
jgi:hypothetical protein